MKQFKYKKYEIDFPINGYYNWKLVCLNLPKHRWHQMQLHGILLHDNTFMARGIVFNKKEFKIIDENPVHLTEKELFTIKAKLEGITIDN